MNESDKIEIQRLKTQIARLERNSSNEERRETFRDNYQKRADLHQLRTMTAHILAARLSRGTDESRLNLVREALKFARTIVLLTELKPD